MKRLLILASLLPLSLLSGCGGGDTDLKPVLVGSWRIRSFSVNNSPPIDCPSNQSAGNFFNGCTAMSIFTFFADGTVRDPEFNLRTYERSRLNLTYYTPAPTYTRLTFSGANDSVLVWHQDETPILPAVDIILERIQ